MNWSRPSNRLCVSFSSIWINLRSQVYPKNFEECKCNFEEGTLWELFLPSNKTCIVMWLCCYILACVIQTFELLTCSCPFCLICTQNCHSHIILTHPSQQLLLFCFYFRGCFHTDHLFPNIKLTVNSTKLFCVELTLC